MILDTGLAFYIILIQVFVSVFDFYFTRSRMYQRWVRDTEKKIKSAGARKRLRRRDRKNTCKTMKSFKNTISWTDVKRSRDSPTRVIYSGIRTTMKSDILFTLLFTYHVIGTIVLYENGAAVRSSNNVSVLHTSSGVPGV